jgi:hypothetical protein
VLLRRRYKLLTIASTPLREPGGQGSKAEAEKVDILFRGRKYKINMFGAAPETRRQPNRMQPVIFTQLPAAADCSARTEIKIFFISAP